MTEPDERGPDTPALADGLIEWLHAHRSDLCHRDVSAVLDAARTLRRHTSSYHPS
jgi:hypothetical protein